MIFRLPRQSTHGKNFPPPQPSHSSVTLILGMPTRSSCIFFSSARNRTSCNHRRVGQSPTICKYRQSCWRVRAGTTCAANYVRLALKQIGGPRPNKKEGKISSENHNLTRFNPPPTPPQDATSPYDAPPLCGLQDYLRKHLEKFDVSFFSWTRATLSSHPSEPYPH